MDRDLKEVIGVLMRVLGGAEISREEVLDLGFEAEGELGTALNETFVQLLEFVSDYDIRRGDPNVDRVMRSALQASLDRIVMICDHQAAIRRIS